MEIQIKVAGSLLIALSLIHIPFPRYFNWEVELKSLSLINRQMMRTHTLFIGITVFLMGLLCITSATELIETNLGRKICLGLGIFWTIRLYLQFFGYSSELWKGKTFETTMHILFSMMWMYLSYVFLMTFYSGNS